MVANIHEKLVLASIRRGSYNFNMLYEGRRFTISGEGQEIARESGLSEVAEAHIKEKGGFIEHIERYIGEDKQTYQWEELRRIVHSLLATGQEEVDFRLARLSADPPPRWGIESSNTTGNLLGIPNIARYIDGLPLHDAAVLSGAEGAQLLHDYPEVEEGLKKHHTNSRLANTAFAGAYLLQEPSVPTLDRHLTDGVVREISFAPDFHGDFRIAVGESFRDGSLTPLGDKVPFAPAGEKKLFAAYHSVEPEILMAAMRYLEIIGMSKKEQAKIYSSILQKAKTDLPAGNFADFGDDNTRQYLDDITDEQWWQKTIEFAQDKGELMHYPITPGNNDYLFVIAIANNNFVIKNVSSSQSEELPIGKEEIEDFLTLLISSPGGRTSAHTLVDMVIARLDSLKQHL